MFWCKNPGNLEPGQRGLGIAQFGECDQRQPRSQYRVPEQVEEELLLSRQHVDPRQQRPERSLIMLKK